MMNMDDDQSEAVDWGDGDDAPEEAAESITAGAEADAVSLASDDDDLEALKKYHQNAWEDSREPPISEPASQVQMQEPVAPAPAPQESRDIQDSTSHSTNESVPNLHGLPPKPSSTVYSKVPSSTLVSTSATAMAQRNAGPNGNHTSPESRGVLPPGWEPRKSRDGKNYYFHRDAGSQWDFPTEVPRPARSNSSREPNKRSDRGRRSRSRERRTGRRSLSPPRAAYRPRSRSVERDTTHRPGRNVSPKREAPRVERERHAPRVRSRPSSRERRPSPKPSRPVERRSRSPPRVRDSRDDTRHGGRQEPSQNHSSRHRSPIPRARSQERDSYRPSHPPKPPVETDRHEQVAHGIVRRRRSWGSPDPSDNKRRRMAASPPPQPRGVDRYVPERSSRMDVDPPISHQETKRPTDVYDRNRELRQALPDAPPRERKEDRTADGPSSLPQPSRDRREERPRETQQSQSHSLPQPSRDRRDPPAGDREYRSSTASHGQRTSPPQTLNTMEPPPPVARTRAPLPPQAEVARLERYGNKKQPPPPSRYAPMDVDVQEGSRSSNLDQPNARNADRGRGRVRSKSPPSRPYEDGGGRSKGGPSGSYDHLPKVDRALHREVVDSRGGMSSRPPRPSDSSQRGRGPKPSRPMSTSNMIPLANPKEFGRGTHNEEAAQPEAPSTSAVVPSEVKNNDQAPRRQRPSRFGPPKEEMKMDEVKADEKQPVIEQEESHPMPVEEQQPQEAMRSPMLEDIPSKPVTLQRPRDSPEEFQRDAPPHMGGLDQDTRRGPFTRREDGLRIDRNRTSISGDALEPTSEPTLGETRASQEGVETQGDRTTEQQPPASPPREAAKSFEGRQTSLLERMSMAQHDGDGMVVDGDESGAGVDKRKPRGKRSNRGARR